MFRTPETRLPDPNDGNLGVKSLEQMSTTASCANALQPVQTLDLLVLRSGRSLRL